jgi:hypothetical protein
LFTKLNKIKLKVLYKKLKEIMKIVIEGEIKGSKENFRNLTTDTKIKFVSKLMKNVKKRIKSRN